MYFSKGEHTDLNRYSEKISEENEELVRGFMRAQLQRELQNYRKSRFEEIQRL